MMALEAPRLNVSMIFLDPSGPSCPAAQVVGSAGGAAGGEGSPTRIVAGDLHDESRLRELSSGCDVVTVEIEHVGVEGLARMEGEGVNVQPSSRVIGIIQDKYAQKVRERERENSIWYTPRVMGGCRGALGVGSWEREEEGRTAMIGLLFVRPPPRLRSSYGR